MGAGLSAGLAYDFFRFLRRPLTHLCGISHPAWGTFHTICTDAAWLSQYTLRCRYATGSGLRPDTR
ncbi:hypothetical protein GBE26_23870 [Escherichia coli]|nr:hypothetical protein [Escherichia coli]